MAEINGSVRVAATPQQVFDFVDDWHNTARYLRGLKRCEPVDPQLVQGIGARFSFTMGLGPLNLDGVMEVVEYDPPHRIVFSATKPMRFRGQWRFTAADGGTDVELINTVELPGGIAGLPVRKVVQSQGQKDVDASLLELKRLMEVSS